MWRHRQAQAVHTTRSVRSALQSARGGAPIPSGPVTSSALDTHAREHEQGHETAAAMARGGGDRSREDDPFSDGGTTGTDSDESSPRGVGARGPGSTSNPILTRLAVSRNPSPLAAATAAPGVCLLRFAWESAAGSLVGAAVGYGKPTPPVVSAIPCLSVRMEPQPRARVYGSPMARQRVAVAPFRGPQVRTWDDGAGLRAA